MADKSIQMQDPKTGENVYPITITDNIYLPNGTPLMKYLNSIPLPLGSLIHSTIPLKNAGLHLADGGELMFGGVYDDFCKYMKGIYDGAELGYRSNVTPAGSVVINNNNVCSGFNANNYLKGYRVSKTSQKWTLDLKIKTGVTSGTSYHQFIYTGGYDANARQISVGISTDGKFVLYLGSGGASWDIANELKSTHIVLADTEYDLRLTFDGSKYTLYYNYGNNIGFSTAITVSSSTAIGDYQMYLGTYVGSSNDYGFKGNIILSDCMLRVAEGSNVNYLDDYTRYWTGTMPILFTDEVGYQEELAIYGQCGKYVITDTYVKLPTITKLTGGLVNTEMTKIASMNEAGLPNIKGGFTIKNTDIPNNAMYNESGAFAASSGSAGRVLYDRSSTQAVRNVTFDASRSNSIYGKSSTVETEYLKYPYYIVVATVTKTEIEVNIDNITVDLNNKADRNGENIDKNAFRLALNLEPVLLWENPTPTSAQAAQTITVDDLTQYKYLLVYFKNYVTNTGLNINISKIPTTFPSDAHCCVVADNSGAVSSRAFNLTDKNSIYIYAGRKATTSNTSQCPIIAFYGLK